MIIIVVLGIYLLLNTSVLQSFSELGIDFIEKNITRSVNTGGEPLRKEDDDDGSYLTIKA